MPPHSCEHLEVGHCVECYCELANRVRRDERECCIEVCKQTETHWKECEAHSGSVKQWMRGVGASDCIVALRGEEIKD